MSAERIPVIGIVGGVGSGKSTLANALGLHFRCGRLDADAAGHRVLEQVDVIVALKAIFGEEILDAQGKILRSALAARVFGNEPARLASRQKLEAVVHPRIRKEIVEQLEAHQSRMDCDILLLDAALLLEAGWANDCDALIFVETPQQLREKRVAVRGWDTAELARREASQMSLEEKRQRADLIVDNSQNINQMADTVAEWLKKRFHLHPKRPSSTLSR